MRHSLLFSPARAAVCLSTHTLSHTLNTPSSTGTQGPALHTDCKHDAVLFAVVLRMCTSVKTPQGLRKPHRDVRMVRRPMSNPTPCKTQPTQPPSTGFINKRGETNNTQQLGKQTAGQQHLLQTSSTTCTHCCSTQHTVLLYCLLQLGCWLLPTNIHKTMRTAQLTPPANTPGMHGPGFSTSQPPTTRV